MSSIVALPIYGDKVFVGVLDGRLLPLDAKSGAVVWETLTVDQSLPYTITGAPRVANGLVYIGNGGAEYGVRGYVSAYDAESGKLRWRFYTVPGNPGARRDGAASDSVMPKAAETWTGEWWKLGGGGTVWDAIVYDQEFDQLSSGSGMGHRGTRRSDHPKAATTCFCRRSWPWMRKRVPTNGTTRRRPVKRGTTRRPSQSSSLI